ncbi:MULTISPECIES: hypothetical protein [unclassified Agarivorans]|uniref:hypothetical protein n=1 Tax=unclassified Agarivorans TaxID=2636026 RepID=UPI003D7E82C3
MGIILSILIAALLWASNLQAQSKVGFDFSLENQLKQPPSTGDLFSNINWLQEQQRVAFRTNKVLEPSQDYQQKALLQYQQVPQWRSSWRGGVRWQAQQNLLFKVKGNRISGHLSLPTRMLCAICKTHLETTVWKDGYVQLQLKSYFE